MRTPSNHFPIALRLHGQDLCFVGVDITTGWFFTDFPDDMPLTPCWNKHSPRARMALARAQEAWHRALLVRGVRVMVEDRWAPMTPELVQRLGDAQDDLVYGYLSGLGWFRPTDADYRACDLPMPPNVVLEPIPKSAEQRRAMISIPGTNILWAIKEVASRSGAAAHAVWRRWPISAFIWTWRVALEPELTKERAKRAPSAALPPEMQAISVAN
jgi:hypothetical protein